MLRLTPGRGLEQSSGKSLGGGVGWELLTPSGNIWCSHGPSFSQSMDNGEMVLAECLLSPSSPVPPPFLGPVVGSVVFGGAWGFGQFWVVLRGAGMACPGAASVVAVWLSGALAQQVASRIPSLLEPQASSRTPSPATWS